MRDSDKPIAEIVESLLDADELRRRLAQNVQERALLQKLLRIAQQTEDATQGREVARD